MKTSITFLALLLTVNTAFAQPSKEEQKIRKIFEKELKSKDVHNAFFAVHSDKLNLDWNWAEGEFKDGTKVTTDNPFFSASIGKTFTATTIVLLQEEGNLQFNDPISNYLSKEIMDSLHIYEGVDYSNEITVSQLLQHRSGLPDYFEDEPANGPSMRELLVTDTAHFWTPIELLLFAKDQIQPHFAPGTGYHYSDTEYILLGMIIENLTGKALHEVFAERIFRPLEMKHTSMYLRSKPMEKTGEMAELYVEDLEISTYTSLSLDWAGGGLLTTCEDLMKFEQALINGEIVSPTSFEKMQNWTLESKGMYYGFGFRKFDLKELFFTLPDVVLLGHSGSTGSFMYYCPEWDVYLMGTFNQTEYLREHVVFLAKVMTALKKRAES
ncbi:serine hydrolase domain-containing protein [Owenweeksia hongkongensis]|uniref:serine hydrolase domain-containing protein n=1 Tax=Owenweeksia hongkongensis TaxID=253245 RepID=UPI003A8FB1D7